MDQHIIKMKVKSAYRRALRELIKKKAKEKRMTDILASCSTCGKIFTDKHIETARNYSKEHEHFCVAYEIFSINTGMKSPHETEVKVDIVRYRFDCGKQIK